jgi:glucose-1-phosphate thymidylyltransferase
MKGIILSAGKGTRVYPTTIALPKSLLPVYDKPLIYYSLSTFIENGINEICIITTPEHLSLFEKTLGDGSQLGLKLTYLPQTEPKGIADAFIIAKDFIGKEKVALLLGDNLFAGSSVFSRAIKNFENGASIFAYQVHDPERYGVIELNKSNKPISIEEKPLSPKSNLAIPGLYIFDNNVIDISKKLKPSARGELEITDVILHYFKKEQLKVYKINRGCAWLDAGTCESLNQSSEYVRVIEERQGIKIGCIEEAALKAGFISKDTLQSLIQDMPKVEYRTYLEKLMK